MVQAKFFSVRKSNICKKFILAEQREKFSSRIKSLFVSLTFMIEVHLHFLRSKNSWTNGRCLAEYTFCIQPTAIPCT